MCSWRCFRFDWVCFSTFIYYNGENPFDQVLGKVVEFLARWFGKMLCSMSLFLQEIELLSKVPVPGEVSPSGNLEGGWQTEKYWREHWRKYRENTSRDEYIINRRDFADYVDSKPTVIRGHSDYEHFTTSTFDCIALSETYLGNYYAKVSTFFSTA